MYPLPSNVDGEPRHSYILASNEFAYTNDNQPNAIHVIVLLCGSHTYHVINGAILLLLIIIVTRPRRSQLAEHS